MGKFGGIVGVAEMSLAVVVLAVVTAATVSEMQCVTPHNILLFSKILNDLLKRHKLLIL